MKKKTCLIIRLGAIGDMLIITPVLKRLKELGYYNILHTGETGMNVFKHTSYIDEFIPYKDNSMPKEKLGDYWNELKRVYKPDKFINFTESIECNVALHPTNSAYIYPKEERKVLCNRNYYDVTEKWADITGCDKRPNLQFSSIEEKEAKEIIQPANFNILWQLSGSGKQKVYPWVDFVIAECIKEFSDIHFITTGDYKCKLLETVSDDSITHLAGEIDIRVAICLTKFVNLVIAPDTGVLHASGCFNTPKIGLLGHTTKENITKYFLNDYSIEAECACSPCFRLIYEHGIQCPIEYVTKAAWCMAVGIAPQKIYNTIKKVYDKWLQNQKNAK